MARKATLYPHEGERVQNCKYCPVRIFWKKTPKGRYMPVEQKSLEAHWGNCPGADRARKPKEGGSA